LSSRVRAKALDVTAALAHSQGDYARAGVLQEEGLALWRQESHPPGVAGALSNLALVAKSQAQHARAAALLQEALDIVRDLHDLPRMATLLNNLAAVAIDQGDDERGRAFLEESLGIKRTLGDGLGIATSLHNLGEAALHQGAYAQAAAFLEESEELSLSLGAQLLGAQTLHSLGTLALRRGELDRALTQLTASLSLMRELGNEWGLVLCIEGLAETASAAGGNELAVRLLGAATAWREASGAPLPPNERRDYEAVLATARAALGEEACAAAQLRGRAMPLEQAIGAALSVPVPHISAPGARAEAQAEETASELTRREAEVAGLIARGFSNRQIGSHLAISEATAQRHVANILAKLGVTSRVQVAIWAVRQGKLDGQALSVIEAAPAPHRTRGAR
jgi:ATP/maltotriose-dependent transcriptional regulator MalT